MNFHIVLFGPPGCGKTTAINLAKKAIEKNFSIVGDYNEKGGTLERWNGILAQRSPGRVANKRNKRNQKQNEKRKA